MVKQSRTLATEEPSIVTVALRPGMVDTDVYIPFTLSDNT
jgi:hypothetical protein